MFITYSWAVSGKNRKRPFKLFNFSFGFLLASARALAWLLCSLRRLHFGCVFRLQLVFFSVIMHLAIIRFTAGAEELPAPLPLTGNKAPTRSRRPVRFTLHKNSIITLLTSTRDLFANIKVNDSCSGVVCLCGVVLKKSEREKGSVPFISSLSAFPWRGSTRSD